MGTDSSYWYVLVGLLAVISGLTNGVLSFMIMRYLSKHGFEVNYWMSRAYMLKYLRQYRKYTVEANGKPGRLYYAWILSIGLLVVSAIILLSIIFSGK